jgi:hypothetical protein
MAGLLSLRSRSDRVRLVNVDRGDTTAAQHGGDAARPVPPTNGEHRRAAPGISSNVVGVRSAGGRPERMVKVPMAHRSTGDVDVHPF